MSVTVSGRGTHVEGSVIEFRTLFEAELPFVLRTLRRLGVYEADLPDVAQELFVSVHDRLPELQAGSAPRRWLYAFCLRFAANYRRLARHRATPFEEAAHASADEGDAIHARALVLRALDALDADRRVALVLHDMEGVTAAEIAELTLAPVNTVYSRIRLAREDFRAEVVRLSRGAAP